MSPTRPVDSHHRINVETKNEDSSSSERKSIENFTLSDLDLIPELQSGFEVIQEAEERLEPGEESKSVFIGRVPFSLSVLDFERKLHSLGAVDAILCLNRHNKSKGFGFATFPQTLQAHEFASKFNDTMLFKDQKLPLRVEVVLPKS